MLVADKALNAGFASQFVELDMLNDINGVSYATVFPNDPEGNHALTSQSRELRIDSGISDYRPLNDSAGFIGIGHQVRLLSHQFVLIPQEKQTEEAKKPAPYRQAYFPFVTRRKFPTFSALIWAAGFLLIASGIFQARRGGGLGWLLVALGIILFFHGGNAVLWRFGLDRPQ